VGALFEPPERLVDLVERLGLHLDQGEFDLVLNIELGALRGIEHALDDVVRALSTHPAHPALDLAHDLAAALFEDRLELVVSLRGHLFPWVMSGHMSAAPFHQHGVRPMSEANMQRYCQY